MNKNLLLKKIAIILQCTLFMGLLLVSPGLIAQNSWNQENYQEQYRTSDQGGGSTGDWVNWEDENWQQWVKQGNSGAWVNMVGYPPISGDANSTYIEIRSSDRILLESTLNYKNNLTLMVCGELHIGTFAIDDMVPSVILDLENIVVDLLNNSVTVNAEYFSETIVDGYEIGFYIAPQGVANLQDPAYKILPGTFTHQIQGGLYQGSFGSDAIDAINSVSLVSGVTYQIVAFAQNETGTGYSVVHEFDFNGNDKSMLFESTEESTLDDINTFNRIRLWICHGGKLSIGTIQAKNNALLHVDGNLVVERMDFDNNYCITGSGNISTADGSVPPIEGEASNVCTGFDGTLPIELLSFTSSVAPGQVVLNWVTASEINNHYYTIERSRDMHSWEVLDYIDGAGNSIQTLSYSFLDLMPQQGLTYYRLKQTDFDGNYEYFTPVPVMFLPDSDGMDFQVAKSMDQWIVGLPGDGAFQVEVYSLSGRRMHAGTAINNFRFPSPGQTVVIRVLNATNIAVSRIVM